MTFGKKEKNCAQWEYVKINFILENVIGVAYTRFYFARCAIVLQVFRGLTITVIYVNELQKIHSLCVTTLQ